jgi:hypothetical protein
MMVATLTFVLMLGSLLAVAAGLWNVLGEAPSTEAVVIPASWGLEERPVEPAA